MRDDFTDDLHLRVSAPSLRFLFGDLEEDSGELSSTGACDPDQRTDGKKEKTALRKEKLNEKLKEAFREGEEKTVFKVLDEIDKIERRQQRKGFDELNFTAGVFNCFLVSYVFGAFPEHFWLLYLVESVYFIPRKFYNMIRAKPLNEALYYFDFCWMMNFSGVFILLLFGLHPQVSLPIPQDLRKQIFLGCFGIACGPLLAATAVLPFVAFIFHDVNTMTNVIIHALPPMMFYTLRWFPDRIQSTWPALFRLDYIDDISFFPEEGFLFIPGNGLGSIAGNSVLIYLCWFIPYVSWMILMGMDLPRKERHSKKSDGSPKLPKFDTVFHSFWRAGSCQALGTLIWKRDPAISKIMMETDDYEVRDFLLYVGIHAAGSLASIPTLAYACNFSQKLHGIFLVLIILICVHRGSMRYTYLTTKMYSKMIRREFVD